MRLLDRAISFSFFFQAEDGIRDLTVTGVQTCALPISTSDKGVNLTEGREHADLISVMLMAFPHLFPASTNQWKPNVERDPGRDTYASPDLFTNYADFYARAAAAAKTAYRASRAQQDDDFKTYVAELRVACDSCHGLYLKSDQ